LRGPLLDGCFGADRVEDVVATELDYTWTRHSPTIGEGGAAGGPPTSLELELAARGEHVGRRWQRVHVLKDSSKRFRIDVARQGVVRAPQQQVLRVHGLQLCGATTASPRPPSEERKFGAESNFQLHDRDSCMRRAHDHLQHSAAVLRAPGSTIPRLWKKAFGDVRHRGLHDGVAGCGDKRNTPQCNCRAAVCDASAHRTPSYRTPRPRQCTSATTLGCRRTPRTRAPTPRLRQAGAHSMAGRSVRRTCAPPHATGFQPQTRSGKGL